jgi:hypothetical protein
LKVIVAEGQLRLAVAPVLKGRQRNTLPPKARVEGWKEHPAVLVVEVAVKVAYPASRSNNVSTELTQLWCA